MNTSNLMIPAGRIEQRILFLRKTNVMLSSDLAELYGVPVKVLNQEVKRNSERFPKDVIRQLMTPPKTNSKQIGFRAKVNN